MMKQAVLWGLVILLMLLVLTHPQGFASAVSSVGGFTLDESTILAGGSIPGHTAPSGGKSGPLYGFNTVKI